MGKHVGDMIANLTSLPEVPALTDGMEIKRVMVMDRPKVVQYIREHFSEKWADEAATSMYTVPSNCVIAVQDGRIVGFASWDVSAKGFFGPIGVTESLRGSGVGKALLLRALHYMRDDGYGYAIIGWVDSAEHFYRKVVGAEYIPGGEPWNSVYSRMITPPKPNAE